MHFVLVSLLFFYRTELVNKNLLLISISPFHTFVHDITCVCVCVKCRKLNICSSVQVVRLLQEENKWTNKSFSCELVSAVGIRGGVLHFGSMFEINKIV